MFLFQIFDGFDKANDFLKFQHLFVSSFEEKLEKTAYTVVSQHLQCKKGEMRYETAVAAFSPFFLSNFGGKTRYFDFKFLRKLYQVNIKVNMKKININFEGKQVNRSRYKKHYETVLLSQHKSVFIVFRSSKWFRTTGIEG